MERTENLIMQEDRWKPLKEMNLTDDFLFDVATAELENCKTIIELSTGLRLKSLKWKEGQKVRRLFTIFRENVESEWILSQNLKMVAFLM